MKDDLGWTETQKGVVLSCFVVVPAADGDRRGCEPLRRLAGPRRRGALVVGVDGAHPACRDDVPLRALIAARIALGLGEVAVFPASMNMISRWVPP